MASAVALLIGALEDPDADVRKAAARASGTIHACNNLDLRE